MRTVTFPLPRPLRAAPAAVQQGLVVLALLAAGPADQVACQEAAGHGTIKIRVALVGQDLEVRPVPLHDLFLASAADTTLGVMLKTDLGGFAQVTIPPGAYRLQSVKEVRFQNTRYSWRLDVEAASGDTVSIELSNANAIAADAGAPSRAPSPESLLFQKVRSSVVKVLAGAAHGTGFVVDADLGLIATNEHVVASRGLLSIMLDSATRLPADVVLKDNAADLAILQVHPDAVAGRASLPLVTSDPPSYQGERVIAVGFPLHQEVTLTSGIVSGIRPKAVITDVNVNPGNSGGPLLNEVGEVVGVSTFADQAEYGPGIYGAVRADQLAPLLDSARQLAAARVAPEYRLLSTVPPAAYEVSQLRSLAASSDPEAYQALDPRRYGDLMLTVRTPVSLLVAYREYEREISKDRRKREERAGLSEEDRYTQFADFRDWTEYAGALNAPVVTLTVDPRIGETSGSSFGRAMSIAFLGVDQQAKVRYKADVQDLRIYVQGAPVVPLIGGRIAVPVDVETSDVEMKDVAYRGIAVLPYYLFRPDSTGAPPSIVVEVEDLKDPEKPFFIELPPDAVARIWEDFRAHELRQRPESTPVTADVKAFRSTLKDLCVRYQKPRCWYGHP